MSSRHNLRTVVRFETLRTLRKKSFWAATLVVPIVIAAVLGLIGFSSMSAGQASIAQKDAHMSFTFLDESGLVTDTVARDVGGTRVTDQQAATNAVRAGTSEAFIHIPQSPTLERVQVYGADRGPFENAKYSALATRLLTASLKERVSPTDLALAAGKVSYSETMFKDGKATSGVFALIPPLLFLAIFYLVILFLGNQILNSAVEEKENRVTEIILTTLSPGTLITGKILAILATGAVQMLTVTAPACAGFLLLRGRLGIPDISVHALVPNPSTMVVGALLLIGGFILFSGALVAIGSVMPTAKDANTMFGSIVLIMFVPLYAVPLILSDPGSPVVQVFTYFPLSAPVTAMLRNGLGSLSGGEAAIVIGELLLLGVLVMGLAVKLFRHGSLNYTSRVSLKSLLKKL